MSKAPKVIKAWALAKVRERDSYFNKDSAPIAIWPSLAMLKRYRKTLRAETILFKIEYRLVKPRKA